MPTPYQHPKTGVYWIRLRVPDRLRDRVGAGLHQRTLGTKDAGEAKVRFAEALAELNEHWARLAAEPGRLTRRQCKALAGEYRRWSIARREDDPGSPEVLRGEIERDRIRINPGRRLASPFAVVSDLLPAFLEERGIVVHDRDMTGLVADCARAEVSAKEVLLRYASGDFTKPRDDEYPEYVRAKPATSNAEVAQHHLSVEEHWNASVAEREHSLGTQKAWKPVLLKFGQHLGRSNLATATALEIENWKVQLLKTSLSRKTIRDTYLSALKSFYEWGKSGGKVAVNPSADVKVARSKADKRKASVDRDLSDADARLILSEALRPSDERTSPSFARAKRWIPWICAYSGARVNEITQVRRGDFSMERVGGDEVWSLLITTKAGTVKSGEDRKVVLHPHLVEQGLIDFVLSRPEGPLFYDAARESKASEHNPPFRKVGDKLARWVREIGVDDPNVDPNHGWRHKFKTTARSAAVRMDHEVREGMTGHATATVGESYGKMPVDRIWMEVCRLPRYEVQPPTEDPPDTAARRKRNADRVATAERAKSRSSLPSTGTKSEIV